MFPGPLSVQTKLTGGTSIAQGLFIEMFLTAELVLTVLFLAAEKSKATFIAPVGIGLSLFVAELTGMYHRHEASFHAGGTKALPQVFTTLVVLSTLPDHLDLMSPIGSSKGKLRLRRRVETLSC